MEDSGQQCGPKASPTDRSPTPRDPVTVELRLEPVANPGGTVHVAGTVSADGRPARPFSGWLDLLGVLEALVDGQK